jgi:hypothetical protein
MPTCPLFTLRLHNNNNNTNIGEKFDHILEEAERKLMGHDNTGAEVCTVIIKVPLTSLPVTTRTGIYTLRPLSPTCLDIL